MNHRNDENQISDDADYGPERLAQLFEKSVDGFSRILLDPLEPVLQRQIAEFRHHVADDIAGNWIDSANSLLADLLAGSNAGLEPAKASSVVRENLQTALSEALPPTDREAVMREALTFAREIAESVLSRWFEILGQADAASAQGLPLNAHLLPGTGTVQSALDEVDFMIYGIDNTTVAKALRVYWDEVLLDSTPVEFGRGLWIVPDVNDWASPYRLFNSASHATEFARRRQREPRVVNTELCDRYASAFAITHYAMTSRPVATGHIAAPASLIDCCLAWQLTPEGESVQGESRSDIFFHSQISRRSPELNFALSVELLFDQVVSVLALSPEEASRQVRSQRDKVMPLLQTYSQKRKVKLGAVLEAVYTSVSLAAATDRRPGELLPNRLVSSENLDRDISMISRGFHQTKPVGVRHLINATLRAPGNVVPMPTVSQMKSVANQQRERSAWPLASRPSSSRTGPASSTSSLNRQ